MNIRPTAGLNCRPDALTGRTLRNPVSHLERSKVAKALIDIVLMAFGFLFLLDAAMVAVRLFVR